MSINTHRHTHGETLGHRAMSWCFSDLALLFFLYVVETTQKNGWQSHMISCSVTYPKNNLRSSQPMAGMASPPLHFWPHWGCLPGWILWEQPPWTVDSMVMLTFLWGETCAWWYRSSIRISELRTSTFPSRDGTGKDALRTEVSWLVVWNIFFPPHIYGLILSIDFHIFQDG